jgi:hypothetical protein
MLNESTAGFWTDAGITADLNEGYVTIAALTKCIKDIESAVTVVGSRVITVAVTKVHFIEYLADTSKDISLRTVVHKHLGQLPFKGGIPTYWFMKNHETVFIDPVPDAVYNLALYVSLYPVTLLTAGTDKTTLPISYDLPVVYYAVMKSFFNEGNYQAASVMNEIINTELAFHETDKDTYFVEDTESIKAPIMRRKA